MDPDSVDLATQAWTDIEAALADGVTTAVVAVGSVEQHGPHLPLLMDTLAGDALSERIATELGDALAAPTIRPGCSGHHMAFPGTITIPAETLMATVRGYVESLAAHGFEHVVLVPTHGGNFAPVNTVAPEVAREVDASVIPLADLGEMMELMNEAMARAGVDYREPVVHAGAVETAMVLAIDRGLVREDRFEVGTEGEVSTARLFAEGFDAVSENGVLGDPREATEEAGEEILATIAETYAEKVETERQSLARRP